MAERRRSYRIYLAIPTLRRSGVMKMYGKLSADSVSRSFPQSVLLPSFDFCSSSDTSALHTQAFLYLMTSSIDSAKAFLRFSFSSLNLLTSLLLASRMLSLVKPFLPASRNVLDHLYDRYWLQYFLCGTIWK